MAWKPIGLFATALAITWAAHGCGRTRLYEGPDASEPAPPPPERCDRLDNDLDGDVDEDFRDAFGRYVDGAHCGACDQPCETPPARGLSVACGIVAEAPLCVATECEPGYVVSQSGRCVDGAAQLCLSCTDDDDCAAVPDARCAPVGGLPHCTVACVDDATCPLGSVCTVDDLGQPACLPPGGDCRCEGDESFEVACSPPDAPGCVGRQRCERGVRSACETPDETCDRVDNDCDGNIDEGFINDVGAYGADSAHCGACGVDCNAGLAGSDLLLQCGGDPFAPSCVVACADAMDGVQPGDLVDADRRIDNGCECRVQTLGDAADDGILDANCDGADGVVTESFYVTAAGDDDDPGSPTRPLRSINVAIARAAESLGSNAPRPDIYVAAGSYAESLQLANGVRIHGGYRSDFLALNPEGFAVQVTAPSDTVARHGAALVADGVTDALVENLRLTGVDAANPGAPAAAVVVRGASTRLLLRGLRIRSGRPGSGEDGASGSDGSAPTTAAGAGAPQRIALETADHLCLATPDNLTAAGVGGRNTCQDGSRTDGGNGGSAGCPTFGEASGAGSAGSSAGRVIDGMAGDGGEGGRAISGPLGGGSSCPSPPCCGLADFIVSGANDQAIDGGAGATGSGGRAGTACTQPLGSFDAALDWNPGRAAAGSDGGHGGGGGGGGAGGGAEFTWNAVNDCTFADGIGGAGGGGGAGGCGGLAGAAGASGGPAIGLLVVASDRSQLPTLRDLDIVTENGGRGGDGGAGGDGGVGGEGGPGGELPRDQRLTPSLSGPQRGERGGTGGSGGPGGAGGGGCGGASVGVWISGGAQAPTDYTADSRFQLGRGGEGGRGGGGPVPAPDGIGGGAVDLLQR